jgi:hypothetical protein
MSYCGEAAWQWQLKLGMSAKEGKREVTNEGKRCEDGAHPFIGIRGGAREAVAGR